MIIKIYRLKLKIKIIKINNMSNSFLFLSNYCQHSKRVLELCEKHNLNKLFTMCNVDNKEIQIPPFINCVPTLYLSTERKILTNEDLFKYVESKITVNQTGNSIGNNEITGSDSISAYHSTELGAGFSDNYSFINDKDAVMQHNYSFLDGNSVNQPSFTRAGEMNANDMSSNKKSEKGKVLDKAYEELMNQRNAEMANSIANMRI